MKSIDREEAEEPICVNKNCASAADLIWANPGLCENPNDKYLALSVTRPSLVTYLLLPSFLDAFFNTTFFAPHNSWSMC